MAKLYRAAAVIVLGLVTEASLISAFKLTFPSLNSTSGATSISWDPQTSSCSYLTIQHQCLPDKYVTTRTSVSEKFKMMPIPVDWLERLIKNGTNHCRAVAQCEDGFPNVSALASIDVYLASNGKGQPTFSSFDTGSGSSTNSATNSASIGSTTSPSTSTFVSVSVSSNSASTTPSSTAGSQTKRSPLGAILGGTLGGLATLLLVIFLLFWRQRRRKPSSEKNLVIETPEPSPRSLPPLTPFVPSSPSSPNEAFLSPNSDRFQIDTNVSPKARMLAGLSGASSNQSGNSSEAMAGATSTSSERTDSADGEATRRQIMDLNSRIMQLEATRRESELETAPPRYSIGS